VQQAFGRVILATIFLVFLITAAVFESWRLPLLVMLSVPLAIVGVGVGLVRPNGPYSNPRRPSLSSTSARYFSWF
jgi:multidrug efflux pump subunit AcrB